MERFMKVLVEDAKVREEFLRQETPEGAYKVAKPYIGSMTQDEFSAKLVALKDAIIKAQSGELSEEDLDAVSGGALSAAEFGQWFTMALQGLGTLGTIGTGIWSSVEESKKAKAAGTTPAATPDVQVGPQQQ